MISKIYLRPAPRLPKILALAVLLDYLRHIGEPTPEVVMAAESLQETGGEIYNLDCHGNGWRERQLDSEVHVVIEDFFIPNYADVYRIAADVEAHNSGSRGKSQGKNYLNRLWGSLGFFTGSTWDIIEQLPKEAGVTADTFLKMCLDVIDVHLEIEDKNATEGVAKAWADGLADNNIIRLLDAKFMGTGMLTRELKKGNYEFTTLSGYIRDLWGLDKPAIEIEARMRPWVQLWRLITTCIGQANHLPTQGKFKVRTSNGERFDGVVFDFKDQKSNPLAHGVWLGRDNVRSVIVRSPSGRVTILTRKVEYGSVRALWRRLEEKEPGLWHHDGGGSIYNGSNSRTDTAITGLNLADENDSIAYDASLYLQAKEGDDR